MPDDIQTFPLTADECATFTEFRDALREQEKSQRRQIVGCGLLVGSTDPSQMANVFDSRVNLKSRLLTPIEVEPVPNDANREQAIARLLVNRVAIQYAEISIGGNPTWVLVSRPGRSLIYTGEDVHFRRKE